jgi:hypothetical protein
VPAVGKWEQVETSHYVYHVKARRERLRHVTIEVRDGVNLA